MADKNYEYLDENVILLTLEVISQLNQGDTLSWVGDSQDTPNIQRRGPFRAVRRFWNQDCRAITLTKINEVVKAAISIAGREPRVRSHLLSASAGLRNLKTTYESDVNFVSTINLCLEEIQSAMVYN
jgi:hypothetical protein